MDDDALLDSTPFHSASRTAAAFTQRHVEESWLHLLLAGDFSKLKDLTVCNFDFLLAAVSNHNLYRINLDSTPFPSASRTAAAFTQRYVEESWLHLLLAGDFSKRKDLTVCNFDFLLAAVNNIEWK